MKEKAIKSFVKLINLKWASLLFQGQISLLTLISVSVPPPWHVKDPGHSAKSSDGRLQINTHAPYICGFE